MKKAQASIGTISHATMRPEDLIPAFAAELRRLRGALPRDVWADVRACEHAWTHGTRDDLDDIEGNALEALFDALDEYAPPNCYFGAHPGDGSDYGFWPNEEQS